MMILLTYLLTHQEMRSSCAHTMMGLHAISVSEVDDGGHYTGIRECHTCMTYMQVLDIIYTGIPVYHTHMHRFHVGVICMPVLRLQCTHVRHACTPVKRVTTPTGSKLRNWRCWGITWMKAFIAGTDLIHVEYTLHRSWLLIKKEAALITILNWSNSIGVSSIKLSSK